MGSSDNSNPQQLKVYSSDEKECLPLALHHTPLTVSFAIFTGIGGSSSSSSASVDSDITILVADPSPEEENVMDGRISYSVNAHKELCGIHKPGYGSLTTELIVKGSQYANNRAMQVHDMLASSLVELDAACAVDKNRRLEKMRAVNHLKSMANVKKIDASCTDMMIDIESDKQLPGDDPLLSWSHLHQSVDSTSVNDK